MKKYLTVLILGLATVSFAEKIVFELSTGKIISLEPDAARVCDGRLESRIVSCPDWSKIGFGQGNDLVRTNTQAIIKPIYDVQSNLVGSITNFYTSTQQKDNIKDVSDFQKLYLNSEVERQAAKPAALKALENKYLKFCDTLSAKTNHAALSLDQITDYWQALSATGKVSRIMEFILIDAAGRKLAGNKWADDAAWHPETER